MTGFRLELDLTTGVTHGVDNVTADQVRDGIHWLTDRRGDGMTFVENATGETWFYPWEQVRALKVIPQ